MENIGHDKWLAVEYGVLLGDFIFFISHTLRVDGLSVLFDGKLMSNQQWAGIAIFAFLALIGGAARDTFLPLPAQKQNQA